MSMNAIQKKKLCWNCEGRVPLDSVNCPYCAVYLGPGSNGSEDSTVLAPPYKIEDTEEQEAVAAPETRQAAELAPIIPSSEVKQVLLPLVFLSGGLLFSLFGIILLLFSKKGVFNLQWNGEYWYLYLAFALPMLAFGWRSLRKFDEQD